MPLYKRLYVQVIAGILLGVAFGIAAPAAAVKMKPVHAAAIAMIGPKLRAALR